MFYKKTLNKNCQESINEYVIFNDNQEEYREIKYEYHNIKIYFSQVMEYIIIHVII